MILRQPMRDTRSSVMRNYGKLLKPKLRHQLQLVLRHHSLRVVGCIARPGRLVAVAVSSEISRHYRVVRRQIVGNLVPNEMCLWMPMQQQKRRARSANAAVDVYAVCADFPTLESAEHLSE